MVLATPAVPPAMEAERADPASMTRSMTLSPRSRTPSLLGDFGTLLGVGRPDLDAVASNLWAAFLDSVAYLRDISHSGSDTIDSGVQGLSSGAKISVCPVVLMDGRLLLIEADMMLPGTAARSWSGSTDRGDDGSVTA